MKNNKAICRICVFCSPMCNGQSGQSHESVGEQYMGRLRRHRSQRVQYYPSSCLILISWSCQSWINQTLLFVAPSSCSFGNIICVFIQGNFNILGGTQNDPRVNSSYLNHISVCCQLKLFRQANETHPNRFVPKGVFHEARHWETGYQSNVSDT